ncbi:unnamed protein product [Trichogramma brassicae]|uniref:Uncharacterized protein n=1 Tax=Trichogramma brassicae TaxID=86971 RepID=A0A6H5HU69_9HYME|nr:unnamed protein product [Trichogramma brassicae]
MCLVLDVNIIHQTLVWGGIDAISAKSVQTKKEKVYEPPRLPLNNEPREEGNLVLSSYFFSFFFPLNTNCRRCHIDREWQFICY